MSYITRMLVEVIKDMLAFGVVLSIVVIAMADAFLSIKEITESLFQKANGTAKYSRV